MATSYDAIVVGAGHNGLTAAAYLASGGPRRPGARGARPRRRRHRHRGAGARRSRPRARPHGRPAAALGRPRARPHQARAVAGLARGPRLRAPARRPGGDAVGRPRQVRGRDPDLVRERRDGVRRVRPRRPLARAVPRRPRRRGAARDPGARLRRRAARAAARARVPRPGQDRRPHDPARPRDGRRRLRGRVVHLRAAARDARLARRPVHGDGPVVGGHDGGPAGRLRGQRRWCRGRDGVREGRPVRPGRCAGVGRPGRGRRDPDLGAGRGGDDRRWRRDRRGARVGRGDPRAGDRVRARPQAAAHGADRPRHARTVAPLAGRQHPDAGDAGQGQPRARRPARVPRGGRRRPAAARPDPGGDDVDRRGRARVRRLQVRPRLREPGPRGDDPVARRPVARRRREGRDARDERADAVAAAEAPAGRLGGAPRRAGRPRGPDARDRRARASAPA